MKSNEPKKPSVTKAMLSKLAAHFKANSKNPKQNPTIESNPLKPAGLDQDSGAAYNPDHTFPQT